MASDRYCSITIADRRVCHNPTVLLLGGSLLAQHARFNALGKGAVLMQFCSLLICGA